MLVDGTQKQTLDNIYTAESHFAFSTQQLQLHPVNQHMHFSKFQYCDV